MYIPKKCRRKIRKPVPGDAYAFLKRSNEITQTRERERKYYKSNNTLLLIYFVTMLERQARAGRAQREAYIQQCAKKGSK